MTMEMTMDASQSGYNTSLLLGGDEQLKNYCEPLVAKRLYFT